METIKPRRLMYDIEEAAAMLSISRSMVYVKMRTGQIASVKVGARRLFAHSDLETFIARHRADPTVIARPDRGGSE